MGRLPSFQHSVCHHSSLLSLLLLPSTSAYALSEVNWIMNRSFLWHDPCAHDQLAHVVIEDSPIAQQCRMLESQHQCLSDISKCHLYSQVLQKNGKDYDNLSSSSLTPQPSLLQSVWKMAQDKEKKELMPCNFYSKKLATLALCMHTVTSVNKLF